MKTLRVFMPAWLLLLGAAAFGQEYSHLHFSTRDGLAGDNIYDIAQDNEGFLWIATETGISRFDGSRFVNFTTRDGLPSNDVNFFFIDRKNRVWISVFKKDICYYYHGQIHNRDNDSLVRRIRVTSEKKCIASDKDDNMLIQTDSGFVLIDTSDRCTTYARPFAGKGFFLPEICDCDIFSDLIHPSLRPYATDGERGLFSGILMPRHGVYVAFNFLKGVIMFGKHGPPQVCYPPAGVISAFPSDDDGFFIHTVHGAYYYHIPSGKITGSFLEGIPVNITLTDRESGTWIGTRGAGLYYFPPGRNVSITHTPEHLPLQAYNFYFGKGRLLLGTNKELWELDLYNRRLSGNIGRADRDTDLLVVPEGNTLKVPDIRIVNRFLRRYPALMVQHYKAIAHCGNSLLTADGGGVIRQFRISGELMKTVAWKGRVTCVFAIDSLYYAGTLDGLYVFNRSAEQAGPGESTLLVPGSIQSMGRSSNGLLWVITANNGAWCLKDNRVICRLTEANGLSSNICKCLYVGKDNNAYIGTINGLNMVSPAKEGFKVVAYFRTDGLVSDNINCVYASGDTVLAGTSEGLSILDVSGGSRHTPCSLSFTDISVSQRRIDPDSATPELAPADNNISFSYAGISFRSMGDIRYTYRLRGLKDEWTHTDQAYLQYPSLPAGAYTLELYATTRFGDRSPLRTFSFSIRRHWWQHAWVQASGLLLLLTILGIVYRFRVRRIRNKAHEQLLLRHKVTELEQLALRAQMNPHFIFNSLNSFYQYVIDKDLAGASKFMSDFSRLIRLLFETTALAEITLDKEISFLGTYLELERTKLGQAFSFSFRVQEGLPAEELLIPSFIIQPFVENSVRHGIQNRRDREGTIEVAISTHGRLLLVVVTDNGVGRRHTAMLKNRGVGLYESKGMKLTTERIAVYNEIHQTNIRFEITDRYENGKAAGTTVALYFPLKDAI